MPDRNDEDRLADLLIKWEELQAQGRDVSAQELCHDCPQLAEDLARRIVALKKTAWMDKPIEDSDPPTSDTAPLSGSAPRTLAGRYRLDQQIGEGGFAQVWRGYDLELQRTVAVKLPKPSRLASVETFIAEARRVARLKHPGIVPIFDTAGCSVQGGPASCFLVSEFVEGGSLRDRIAQKSVSQEQAVRWIAEVAEALDYAHRQGFIHRDLSPANILIDHHGRALLTDFGIAVVTGEASGPSFGTLRYMAPEQVAGGTVDARSDIYSLGVVLHELLTGRLPYSSTDPNTLRAEIASGTTTINVPAEFTRIVRKALAHNPGDRYATAAEFAADLRRVRSSGSSRWKWAGALVLLLLVVVGLAVWSLQPVNSGQANGVSPSDRKPATVEDALALGKQNFDKNYYEQAEAAYSEAIRLDPECVEAYKRRAACKFNQGRYKDSIPDFTKAMELDPNDADICKDRALAYASLREFDQAIADLEAGLKLGPVDAAPFHDLLARSYSNRAAGHARGKRFAEAAADVTQAMKHDPEAAVFYHQRGSCYFNLKEYEEAAADFTGAIKREPGKSSHYLHRGYCLQALGKDDEAEADFQKAKELEGKRP